MYTRREERYALQEARDMGIVHPIRRYPQPAGDLWVGVGELSSQPLDRVEFAIF